MCGGHSSGAGIGVERLLDALGLATLYRLVEAHRLLPRRSDSLDVSRKLAQLALQVIDPSGERFDLPHRIRDLGSVAPPVERPVVLNEGS
jgi:hypothetical protein